MRSLITLLLPLAVSVGSALGQGPAKPAAEGKASPAKAEAQVCYQTILDKYMHGKWVELDAALKTWPKYRDDLTPEQRSEIQYIAKARTEHRPAWWPNARSSKNITFTVEMWGMPFKANYMPSEILGVQMPVEVRDGRFVTVVSWQPNMVDNPRELDRGAARRHKMTEGDYAEGIVWHELGHNYITQCLPAQQLMTLHDTYTMLFSAVQEFYADLTALHYCGPCGRRCTMMMRTSELRWNDETDPHTRAGNAVGALVLAVVLEDPRSWPSFRLPGKVPDKDVERLTVLYTYNHLDPNYTLAEDRALREVAGKFMRTQGAGVLRKKGTVVLPNKLELKLMAGEDREMQVKRDAWVKERLQKAINSGLADKVKEGEDEDEDFDEMLIRIGRRIRSSSTTRPKSASPESAPATKPQPTVEPKPEPKVEPKPGPAVEPKPDDPEKKADALLQKARNYIRNNLKEQAKAPLKEILAKYPKTAAAKEAEELIRQHGLGD